MKNSLLFLLFLCLGAPWAQAQITYEDFEGGASIPWVGINGIYDGAVANPDMSGINTSATVGSYTLNAGSDFNFAIGDLPGGPADMTQFNLFKVKIWSPIAPSKVLLKFEGSGPAVERFADITVANQWVEYSFDLSGGAGNTTGLTKCLISFNSFLPGVAGTFYWDDIRAVSPVTCYETFEGGNALPWVAGGTSMFMGPVDNPAPNSVNSSAKCGQYVKEATGYSLLIADNGTTAFDLSVQNQFKMDVYTSAPTQVLFKLEGQSGPAIEVTKNIGVTNAWQTYTFDLSAAAAYTNLTKVVIFFDPGVDASTDTYYFDNICAVPKGACTGVANNPDIIDDFECSRNATYTNGWDILQVVDNPAPSAINNSSKVGRYEDPPGQWENLLIDYQNPIDLSVKNQFKAIIWSSKTTQILFKLEGGTSAPSEVWVDVTEANKWVEYEVDFSSQAAANHKKIVLFFSGGQDPTPGDLYYIDDLQWGEQTSTVLEDFENGAFLPWEPLDQQILLHGIFAVVNNPAPGGVNTSAKVGKYTKGTAAFSTVTAVAPAAIDISSKPQYNLDVWAPIGSVNVTMQLESASQGNKEVTRDLQSPGSWETLSFDFSDFQNITDWVSINLLFNPGVAEPGAMFFYDNLNQGASTVDPCEGILPIANIIDDFECQRNYAYGAGAADLTVVDNPLLQPINQSTKVGLYTDPIGQSFAALCADIPDGIDLSVFNQLSVMVLAPDNLTSPIPLLMKLEGGTSPAAEIFTDMTTPGDWEKITVDFSNQVGQDHKRACLFFNAGVEPTAADEYYIDNFRFDHAPFDGCIMNFDDVAFSSLEWKYFPNDTDGPFSLADNPNPSGINTSAKVGKAVENASSGQPWQGMYADLPAAIKFGSNKLVKMKVYAPAVASVTMKLENPANPNAPASSGDNTVANTKANEWEEMTWDFSASPNPLPDDGDYQRVTIIWDINELPTADRNWYFDDLRLDNGNCTTTGVFEPTQVESLKIAPNPVANVLRVENLAQVSRLDIFNLVGNRVASVWVGNDSNAALDVSSLPAGMYVLAGYDGSGLLVGNSKFVKE